MAVKLPKVGSKYGAPMGRRCFGLPPEEPNSVELIEVKINSGGYDQGGAYWGLGSPLYMATAEGYQQFTRAVNRAHAAAILHIPAASLKRGLGTSFSVAGISVGRRNYQGGKTEWHLVRHSHNKSLEVAEVVATLDEALDRVAALVPRLQT